MKPDGFGVIIKVTDLDLCRTFYRDVLNLGTPCIDSSFLVQFQLTEGFSVTLLKTQAPFLEHASSAMFWCFACADTEKLSEKLSNSGYPALLEATEFGSAEYLRGRDPENNIFYVKRML